MNTQLNLFATIADEPTPTDKMPAIKNPTQTPPNGAKTWKQWRDEYHAHHDSCDSCDWKGNGLTDLCPEGLRLFRLSSR